MNVNVSSTFVFFFCNLCLGKEQEVWVQARIFSTEVYYLRHRALEGDYDMILSNVLLYLLVFSSNKFTELKKSHCVGDGQNRLFGSGSGYLKSSEPDPVNHNPDLKLCKANCNALKNNRDI